MRENVYLQALLEAGGLVLGVLGDGGVWAAALWRPGPRLSGPSRWYPSSHQRAAAPESSLPLHVLHWPPQGIWWRTDQGLQEGENKRWGKFIQSSNSWYGLPVALSMSRLSKCCLNSNMDHKVFCVCDIRLVTVFKIQQQCPEPASGTLRQVSKIFICKRNDEASTSNIVRSKCCPQSPHVFCIEISNVYKVYHCTSKNKWIYLCFKKKPRFHQTINNGS